LELLTHLVGKSLVERSRRRLRDGSSETRYRMLETVREYARNRLLESGESERVRRRHLDFFLGFLEEAREHRDTPEEGRWQFRIEADYDNLVAALDHCPMLDDGVESELRLVPLLLPYWNSRGYWTEGRRRCEEALARSSHLGRTLERGQVHRSFASVAHHQGYLEEARRHGEEHLVIERELGTDGGVAIALNNLGGTAADQGDLDYARKVIEEGLALQRKGGERDHMAFTLDSLGLVAFKQGDFDAARAALEESLEIFREMGFVSGIATALENLGRVAEAEGQLAEAKIFFEEALALQRELGDLAWTTIPLAALGRLATREGDTERAWSYHEESLRIRLETEDHLGISESLLGMGLLSAAIGSAARAARLFGAAEALRDALRAPLSPAEQALSEPDELAVRDALGEETFRREHTLGRGWSVEEATEYALQGAPQRAPGAPPE
jgi:tetratricopeptide (TPR) repeat protein